MHVYGYYICHPIYAICRLGRNFHTSFIVILITTLLVQKLQKWRLSVTFKSVMRFYKIKCNLFNFNLNKSWSSWAHTRNVCRKHAQNAAKSVS